MNEIMTMNNNDAFALCRVFSVDDAYNLPAIRYSTTDDSTVLFNALNSPNEQVADYIDQEVVVEDIVITGIDLEDKFTGQSTNKPVVHFFTDDGKHISSIANGILRTTLGLLKTGVCPNAEHPITIRFRMVKVKRGMAHGFDVVNIG